MIEASRNPQQDVDQNTYLILDKLKLHDQEIHIPSNGTWGKATMEQIASDTGLRYVRNAIVDTCATFLIRLDAISSRSSRVLETSRIPMTN